MPNRGSGQGIELDVVYLSITGETRQLFAAITGSIQKGQRYADTHPIKIKGKVDVSNVGPIKVAVTADKAGFVRDIEAAHAKAQRAASTIKTTVDLDTAPASTDMAVLRKQLARQGNIVIGVELDDAGVASAVAGISAAATAAQFAPDLSGFSDQIQNELTNIDLTGFADRLRQEVAPVLADIGGPVDIDVAAASTRLDELTRNRNIHIGVDVDWIPILLAVSTLLALRRQVEITLGIPVDEILALDTTLANLTRTRHTQIELDLDQSSAAAVETRLDTIARNRRVELNVDSAALAGLTALGSHTVTLDVELNQASLGAVNAAIDHIARDRTVVFHADIDADSARTVNELLDRVARRRSVEFHPSLDRSEALRMEVLLGLLSRDRRVHFDSDGLQGVGRDANDAHRSLSSMSAIKFTGLLAGIGAIAPLLLGAAGAAGGLIATLGVGLAALGPVAAAAAGTVAVGVQGIGDAFKTLAAAQESAGADAKAQARAIASAQDQVIAAHEQVADAIDGVKTAQRTLTDAQKDARDAAKDIGQAYKDATHDLEDYTFAVKDASLSEAEAKLALQEARDEFAKALPQDREKAFLRLQRADLRYQESVAKNRDTQNEANDALAKGVEGSDKVVAAKDRAAQADQRVADAAKGVEKAQQQVEKAQRQVEKAQQALTDATNQTSSAQDKAAAAFAKLSPNAQEFVLAARAAKPAWEELTRAVQDRLFDGAAAGIGDLVKNSLPTLKTGMTEVAGSINDLTKDFAAFWQAPQNLAAVKSIFAGTASFIQGLSPGLQQATTGFLSFGAAFEPVANKVGAQVGNLFGQIGQAFTDAFQNGSLTQLFSTFGDIIEGLGQGLKPFIAGLIEIGNIVGPTLGPLFATLGQAFKDLAPSLGALGKTFVQTLTALMPTLTGFIDALARGLEPVLPVIGRLLDSIGRALIPLIGPLSQIAITIGNALVQAIDALAPSIGPIGDAFAAFVAAVAPMIPLIAEVVSGILQALAPALKTIFDALAPVIKQWADLMMPVFRQLQPILAEVAQTIGTAIADALVQISPYIPDIAQAFSELVLALAPLLPQIVELAVSLLPPLMDLFIAILPQILDLVDAFTWLVKNVIEPYVLPAMRKMADVMGWALETAASAVTTARDKIGGAIDKMSGFFSGLSDAATKAWGIIVRTIKSSVTTIGVFLLGMPEISIPDLPGIPGRGTKVGFKDVGQAMVTWGTAPALAMGGIAGRRSDGTLFGPGTGTSDSIIGLDASGIPTARVSAGEGVVTKAAMNGGGTALVAALNAGWVPSAELLHAMLPGFAEGVPGKKFAQSMDPAKYLMGGFSRTAIDCSGIVSATVNAALGLPPFASRMSTISEGSWLAAKGAKNGLGGPGDISIGWYDRGGGANGHTAMTLSDGTNVESNGTDGVVIGGPVGAKASMFDKHMYLPKDLLRGGDLGNTTSGTSGGRPGKLGPAPAGTSNSGLGASTNGTPAAPGSTATANGQNGTATPVFVTNWPGGGLAAGGSTPASTDVGGPVSDAADSIKSAVVPPATPQEALRAGLAATAPGTGTPEEEALRATLAATPPPGTPRPPAPGSGSGSPGGGPQGSHPLAGLPVPGFDKLFNGPAPWYLAASPEAALMNLGTQAAGLAQRTGSDVMGFFQNNWKEMLNTGLAVAGMGAGGGGGAPQMINTFNGMDPHSAAAAVERVIRRRTLANQRGGGFGR